MRKATKTGPAPMPSLCHLHTHLTALLVLISIIGRKQPKATHFKKKK